MSNLFHLAQDAAKALTAYEKGLAKKKAGHTEVINAIIEYGKALLQGSQKRTIQTKNLANGSKTTGSIRLSPFDQRQETQLLRCKLLKLSRSVPDGKHF